MKVNNICRPMRVFGLMLFAMIALSASAQTVLQDNFSGTALNTANWTVTGAAPTVNNGLAIPAGSPDGNYIASAASWAASSNSAPLRVTINYTLQTGTLLFAQLMPVGTNYSYKCKGYGNEITSTYDLCYADAGSIWGSGGPPGTLQVSSTGTATIRMTLDPAQGALWEMNTGSRFAIAKDTRGGAESQDPATNATNWQVVLCAWSNGSSTPVTVNSVLVEYDQATATATPTPIPASGIVLQDNFSGTTLNTANWTVSGAAPTQNNGLTIPAGAVDVNYITSAASWAASNNSAPLQVTVNYTVQTSATLLWVQFIPAGISYSYKCKTYGNELYGIADGCYADAGGVWGNGGPPGYRLYKFMSTKSAICRMTLDPTQGALWEMNTGSGFVTAKDTRGGVESQDPMTNATNWQVVLCCWNNGATIPASIKSVLVEYVAPPAKAGNWEVFE